MASDYFENAAWYLYTYTGTASLDEWKQAIHQFFRDPAAGGAQEATKTLEAMVAYYCLEVGNAYKGDLALTKFRKCYRWEDFRIAMKDPEQWLLREWSSRIQQDRGMRDVRLQLAKIPSVPPAEIHNDPVTREALNDLLEEYLRRHGQRGIAYIESVFRQLVSIYDGHPILVLATPEIPGKEWSAPLRNREVVPNLLSSYFIERAIYSQFGDSLINIKEKENAERMQRVNA